MKYDDDLVMSLAIAWQMYQTEMPPVKLNNNIPQYKPTNFMVGG